LPKTVTRQRRGCDLNPGPSAPEPSTLTSRLPRREFSISAKSVCFKLLLNCYTAAAPQTSVPPTPPQPFVRIYGGSSFWTSKAVHETSHNRVDHRLKTTHPASRPAAGGADSVVAGRGAATVLFRPRTSANNCDLSTSSTRSLGATSFREFHEPRLVSGAPNRRINKTIVIINNNNNNHDNVYGAIVMTEVIATVHSVHLMNAD